MAFTGFRTEDKRWTVTGWHVNDNGYSRVTEEAFAAYTGPSEFFSGLRPGNMVTVVRETYFRPDGTLSSEHYAAHKGGARLGTEARHLDFTLAAYDPESHEEPAPTRRG